MRDIRSLSSRTTRRLHRTALTVSSPWRRAPSFQIFLSGRHSMAEILQYIHKDGFFHRLAPFTKIVFIVVISLMCIISINLAFLAILVIAILVLAYFCGLHREILQQSKLILVMSLVFIVITIITMPNGEVLGYLIPPGIPLIGGSIP